MTDRDVVIVGGGAAGFFAAITCAEANPGLRVTLLERAAQFLAKVRISGGGRCNVTHACFDPRELSAHYPRGGAALLGPFQRFQPRDTIEWFQKRGVHLKTESDGRIFPVTDSSQTIIDCLLESAADAGVELATNRSVESIARRDDGFELTIARQPPVFCRRLMLATGGCRAAAAGQLAVSLGHSLVSPVPSLFTFHVAAPWLTALAGISLADVRLTISDEGLTERGALLITHAGLSGPAVLRASAWGARMLHARQYRFPLKLDWLPHLSEENLAGELERRRSSEANRLVVNTPLTPLPARLWEALVLAAGLPRQTRWAHLPRALRHQLSRQLKQGELEVVGKTLNQEEFVTCGGVPLNEVHFKTMESRICPGLYFGGELLDIDGVTGGFNFQSAWTTGWIAGQSMQQPTSP